MNVDEAQWPLVRIEMNEAFTAETVAAYIQLWEQCLLRKQRFGLLMIQPGDSAKRPNREVTATYVDWCKAHKAQIAQYCAGIAVVLPSSKLLLLYKPVTALSTRKMYGCPGQAFPHEAEAAEWLKGLLSEADGTAGAGG
ncbi:hypothetical protein [Paenibacillus sp. SYP-B4298]|uniref:hypothetical protein n=1 Tax=Paenibacillus sp. SYP-B4298 TaxID=2996034 RepID=UPI0022DD4384|nr:hypothetical protein [Paenibacillus sp. SYP-B4298]